MQPLPSASALRSGSNTPGSSIRSRVESAKSQNSASIISEQQRRGGQTRQAKGQTPSRKSSTSHKGADSNYPKRAKALQGDTPMSTKKKVDTIVLDARPGKGVETGYQLPRQTLDVDNLIGACTQKLSVDPTHEKALFIRASSFVKRRMFDEAIADCNKLMDLNPHNANAFYVRGTAFERLG